MKLGTPIDIQDAINQACQALIAAQKRWSLVF